MEEWMENEWFNPLDAKLNPICHLLALVGAHHILHVSRVRVNGCIGEWMEEYIARYEDEWFSRDMVGWLYG